MQAATSEVNSSIRGEGKGGLLGEEGYGGLRNEEWSSAGVWV